MSKRAQGFYLTKMLLPQSKYSVKSPYTMTPEAITVHNTANSATAMQEASYVVNGNGGVSYHYAVDETRTVQILPHNRNGWHAGDGRSGRGNRKTIAIEIARSLSKGNQPFDQAELNGAYLTAALLHQYSWGMNKVKKHQDWSGKYCPHRTLDKGWARFLKLVEHELNLLKNPKPTPKPTTKIRIEKIAPKTVELKRNADLWNADAKSWNDFKSQKKFKKGDKLVVVAILHNETLGAKYYMTEYSYSNRINNGFNTVDCVDVKPVEEYLQLSALVDSWAVYAPHSPIKRAYAKGFLNPKKFGGLEYKILSRPMTNVAKISTRDFGIVHIYIGKETAHEIVRK